MRAVKIKKNVLQKLALLAFEIHEERHAFEWIDNYKKKPPIGGS